MITEEFFEAVYKGKLVDSDIYNHIENITDEFNQEKLQRLCDDFDRYLIKKHQENAESAVNLLLKKENGEISEEEYNSKIAKRHRPIFFIDDFFSDRTEKRIDKKRYELKEFNSQFGHIHDDIDLNEINLFPLRNLLIELKRKHIVNSSNQKKYSNSEKLSGKSNQIIDLSVFEKIIYLTNYHEHSDKTVIDKLLNRETDYLSLSNAFKKELQKNIVIAQSQSSLKRLLKHYLFELNEVVRFKDFFSDIFIWSNIPNTHNEDFRQYQYKREETADFKRAEKSENYIIAKYDLLKLIINELELGIVRTEFSIDSLINEMKRSFPFVELDKYLEISKILEDQTNRKENRYYSNHIKWLGTDNTLEQFIEALIDHNLIEEREPQDIIKDHFKPVRKQNKEPEPIEWLNTQALLAYMIDQLDKTYIQTTNIWKDTAPHFSVNSQTPKNLRQTAKGYRDNKTGRNGGMIGKPKNHQLIDDILQHLPE